LPQIEGPSSWLHVVEEAFDVMVGKRQKQQNKRKGGAKGSGILLPISICGVVPPPPPTLKGPVTPPAGGKRLKAKTKKKKKKKKIKKKKTIENLKNILKGGR